MAQIHAIKWLVALLAVQFVTSEPPTITKTDNGVTLTMKYVNQPVMELKAPDPDPSPGSEPSSQAQLNSQKISEEPGKDGEPQLPLPKPLTDTETDTNPSPASELKEEPISQSLAKNQETEPGNDDDSQLPLPKPLPGTETDPGLLPNPELPLQIPLVE